MSPMRRVAEAARRTPDTHYTDNVDTPRESQEMIDVNDEADLTSRQLPPTERNIPTTNEQWEDNNREPEIIMEQIPLLNGVLPTS